MEEDLGSVQILLRAHGRPPPARALARAHGNPRRMLQHTLEVADAFIRAARAGVASTDFGGAHVCDLCGADTTIGEVVAAIQQVEPNAQVRIDGEPLPFVSGLDDGALRNLVGDWPRVELDAGVAHTIESFKDLLARGLLSGEDVYRDPLGQGHHAPYDA